MPEKADMSDRIYFRGTARAFARWMIAVGAATILLSSIGILAAPGPASSRELTVETERRAPTEALHIGTRLS